MMVVLAIIAILSVIATQTLFRARPEATLEVTSVEMESLFRYARQEALARGRRVAVLVFPLHGEDAAHRGRFVVLVDEPDTGPSFFNAAQTPNFKEYDPRSVIATPNGKILDTVDLPRGVLLGRDPADPPLALVFPYNGINTTPACSFCGAEEGERGAVVFDARGRTTFWAISSGNIQQILPTASGASLTIHHVGVDRPGDYRKTTVVITSPQGTVRVFRDG
jgi:type II secretory pathway pseudopilin PulG